MAQRATSRQGGSIAVVLAVIAVALALALVYYHLPGGIALWISVLIIALIEPAPMIGSGSRAGVASIPTPAEESRMRDYRGIKRMLPTLVWPQTLLANGVTLAFFVVLTLGLGIFFLPLREIVINHKVIPMLIQHAGNAVLGALAIYALYSWTAMRRRDPPLVTVKQAAEIIVKKDIVTGIIVVGLGAGAGVIAGSAYAGWLRAPLGATIGIEFAAAVLAMATIGSITVRKPAQQQWHDTLEAIDYWGEIWPALKLASLPTIVERALKLDNGVTMDRGSIHFASGPQAIMNNASLVAAIPTDVRLFRLYEMESVGVSSSLFRLVLWPVSAQPEIGSPEISPDLVGLWINGVVQETLRSNKIEAAIFLTPELLTGEDSPRGVYRLGVSIMTSGVSMAKIYEFRHAIATAAGSRIIIDMSGEAIFCGDFENATYDNPQHQRMVNDVASLQVWTERLDIIKFAQPPVMLAHAEVTEHVSVDMGSIPFAVGPAAVLSNPTILAAIPPNIRLFRLYVPDESAPETASKTLFRFLSWDASAFPNIADPECPLDIVQLWLEANITETMRSYGFETGVFIDIEPLAAPNSPAAAYLVKAVWTADGISMDHLQTCADAVGAAIGVPFLAAPDQDTAFCGDFSNTIYDEPEAETLIQTLMAEQEWAERWHTVLDNPNDPQPYMKLAEQIRVEMIDGRHCRLEMVPFAPRLSLPPSKYFGTESKLATVLKSAPMVSVIPFISYNRANDVYERHARLFRVVYSNSENVPSNPARMVPDKQNGVQYIIWWKVNQVISSLGMEIPDVYSVRTINKEQAPRQPNLWEIRLRFYGKLKFADIVNAYTKLQQAFQCDWLRIRSTSVGADLFVGPNRETMEQYYSQDVLDFVDDLDWEHAWRIANITGPNLSVPIKVSGAHPPYNDRVTEYVFELPRGFTPSKVKMSLDTLKTAVGLSFIDMSEIPDSPNEIRVVASRAAPLPKTVPMDFRAIDEMDGAIPLGVSITGEIVTFDRKSTSHLLVVGATGTGKAQPLDEQIPVPISERFPTGVAQLGELEVGDRVFGLNGETVPIVGLSDITNERAYRVTLDSGERVRCSGEHLWFVLRERPKDRSSLTMVQASGLMNIATPVRISGSMALAEAYRHEIELLTKSATGSDPYMRAVLTTKELIPLIRKGQAIKIISGQPTPGVLQSFLDMDAGEIFQSIRNAEKSDDWMIQSAAPMFNELEIRQRHELAEHLLDYLTVEIRSRWRVIRQERDRLAYRILRSLMGSLSAPMRELDQHYLMAHLPADRAPTLRARTIVAVDSLDDTVPMRCISVDSQEHCYLTTGYVPTHNSVLTRTLIYGSLMRGDEVYIIDPIKQAVDLMAFKPYARGFTVSHSRMEALGYLTAIYQEVKRRQEVNAKYGAENGLSLSIPSDERYPFILVELDEFAQLMYPESVSKNLVSRDPSQNQAIINAETENSVILSIGRLVGAIAAVARSTLVTLVLATQRMDRAFLDAIPQGGNLKTNLGRILLGNASIGERASALRNVDTTPRLPVDSPQGRAVYEPSIGRGVILQSWYSPPEEIQAALAERLQPLPPTMQVDPYASLPTEMMTILENEQHSEPVAIYFENESQVTEDLFQEMLAQVVAEEPEPEPEPELDPWELYDREHPEDSTNIMNNDESIRQNRRNRRRSPLIDLDAALSTREDYIED